MPGCRVPILIAALAFSLSPAIAQSTPDPIERAFSRLYNFDFQGAHAILNGFLSAHPADPLPHAIGAAVDLFYELDRLAILEGEFFADDRRIADKKKLKPDPAVRARFFQEIADTQSRAHAVLSKNPDDERAMYADCITHGLVMDYTALVEKKQLRSLSLVKRANACAQHLLKTHPKAYDAYLTTGFTEYLVGSLPFYIRWVVRFDDVQGSKEQAVKNLQLVAREGHYLRPYAKVLLAIIFLREKQPQETVKLLSELALDYPQNPLFRKELAKIAARLHSVSDGRP